MTIDRQGEQDGYCENVSVHATLIFKIKAYKIYWLLNF